MIVNSRKWPCGVCGKGVHANFDVSNSSGPDKLPGRLLQCLAKEITPVVHFIFALAN